MKSVTVVVGHVVGFGGGEFGNEVGGGGPAFGEVFFFACLGIIFQKIEAREITRDAVGDVQIFPSIVVKIGQQRRPAPVGIGYAR